MKRIRLILLALALLVGATGVAQSLSVSPAHAISYATKQRCSAGSVANWHVTWNDQAGDGGTFAYNINDVSFAWTSHAFVGGVGAYSNVEPKRVYATTPGTYRNFTLLAGFIPCL